MTKTGAIIPDVVKVVDGENMFIIFILFIDVISLIPNQSFFFLFIGLRSFQSPFMLDSNIFGCTDNVKIIIITSAVNIYLFSSFFPLQL